MSISFGTLLAVFLLFCATWVVGFNYAVVFISLRKWIRKTDERVPSGIFLVGIICAWSVARLAHSSRIIFWWSLGILLFDPYNWLLLYLPFFLLKEKFKAGKNKE